MPISPKNWQDSPSTATPINAAALEDLETRVTTYGDDSFVHQDGTGLPGSVVSGASDQLVTTKGDLPVGASSGVRAMLAAGANGTMLVADSTKTLGVKYEPKPWADPYDHGFDPVGADAQPSIAATIAALPASGGRIILPAGVLPLGSSVVCDGLRSLTIEGAGGVSAGAQTATQLAYSPATGAAISARSTYGFQVKDVQIMGPNTTADLIDLSHGGAATDSAYFAIKRCYMQASAAARSLINLDKAIDGLIADCPFANAGYHIIGHLNSGGYSNAITVRGCAFTQATTAAIQNPGNAWKIDGCDFEALASGAAGGLIWAAGCTSNGLAITNNWMGDVTLTNNGNWLDFETASTGIFIAGNYIGGGLRGLYAAAALHGLTVIGNTFDTVDYPLDTAVQGSDWVWAANNTSTCVHAISFDAGTIPLRSIIVDDKTGTADMYGMTRSVAGAVSDASFPAAPPNGTMGIDSTNNKLYVRYGGAWKSTALT